jgi:hypothetical protein
MTKVINKMHNITESQGRFHQQPCGCLEDTVTSLIQHQCNLHRKQCLLIDFAKVIHSIQIEDIKIEELESLGIEVYRLRQLARLRNKLVGGLKDATS